MKIWGTRFSLIGDIVMSLPILPYLNEQYGEYYSYLSIAQKCKQALPLFLNQPFINEIKISDYHEDLGELDRSIMSQCDLVLNVKPQHPFEQDWYNYRSCVEETALMAGFNPTHFTNKNPKLIQYWQDRPKLTSSKSIVIWPFAGYGKDMHRSPSVTWWEKCINILINELGYQIIHAGAESEPDIMINNSSYKKITSLSFFDQIKESLNCDLAIGTDSGSMWVIGAYSKIPQINLITNWLPNHRQNLLSLAPAGTRTTNLFGYNQCDTIIINDLINEVCKKIK
jgi:ADP-heptose:LPS heptosyltransferase